MPTDRTLQPVPFQRAARPLFVGPLPDVSHAVGWRGLANYLTQLGIPVSWTALETRSRRYGLPTRGRGVRGREVVFSREDIGAWVEHLTGLRLNSWLSRLAAAQGPDSRLAPRRRRRVDRDRFLRSVIQFPVPLYAVTTTTRALGEQVVRRGGAIFASTSTESLTDFDPDVLAGADCGYWRYDLARIATPADLHSPRLSSPKRMLRAATRLIGALVPGSPEWSWVRVRGEYFGLADGEQAVPFLAADGLPRLEEAVAEIRTANNGVAFVTWTRRIAVTPVLFEPLGPPPVDIEALIDGR